MDLRRRSHLFPHNRCLRRAVTAVALPFPCATNQGRRNRLRATSPSPHPLLLSTSDKRNSRRLIPIATVAADDDQDDEDKQYRDPSTIFLEELEKGEEVRVLPHCKHVYYRGCIDAWLLRYLLRCPICRDETLAVPVPPTCDALVS